MEDSLNLVILKQFLELIKLSSAVKLSKQTRLLFRDYRRSVPSLNIMIREITDSA